MGRRGSQESVAPQSGYLLAAAGRGRMFMRHCAVDNIRIWRRPGGGLSTAWPAGSNSAFPRKRVVQRFTSRGTGRFCRRADDYRGHETIWL